jgi:hypothetical protein
MSTKEIKKQALEILNSKGGGVKLSDFNIKQAKQVIKEYSFLNS